MDIIKIGRFIASRRRELGLTQSKLGEQLEVSNKSVSKWERGICLPEASLLGRLAVILKISLIELMDGQAKDSSATSNSIHCADAIAAQSAGTWQEPDIITPGPASQQAVSPYLFGSNLEHTRSNITNGLSAQMLRNRKFAGKPAAGAGYAQEWYPIGKKVYFMLNCDDPYTRHAWEHYHMKRMMECNSQRIVHFSSGSPAGIGQHGLWVEKEKEYEFSVVLRSIKPGVLTVCLTGRTGSPVYAQEQIAFSGKDEKEWNRYCIKLRSCAQDEDADLRLFFTDENAIELGAVSLMNAENFRGMRPDVIEALKKQGIKLLRWPGGNFAGEYNWFDGLLPADMRAPFQSYLGLETQPHSMGFDYHEINTDDFVALCRLIGAEPFITINPAWNTPQESAAWVEYCNGGPDTEYGRIRISRGHQEPYHVQLWSLGNEFGYGHMEGDNTPYGYSRIAREHADAMRAVSKELTLCSSGPYPNKDWADHAAGALRDIAKLTSLHYYAPQRNFSSKEHLEEDYRICLASVETAREKIHTMRRQLGSSTQISFDEWNTWYAWYRPSCVTDGMFTALMLHMIIREAEKSGIALACHFEAINEGTIEANRKHARLTASGQAFSAIQEHSSGRICYQSSHVLITQKDNVHTLTAINPSFDREQTLRFSLPGSVCRAELYHGKETLPYSYFELESVPFEKEGNMFRVLLPPHSLILFKTILDPEKEK